MTFFRWSKTASDNDDADTSINLREGWSPRIVNDSIRAMMAAAAKYRDDTSGTLLTGGTSTAYTLTTNQVFTSLTSGLAVTVRMNATSGAAPTLNVDGLGAKAIASAYGTAIPTGKLRINKIYTFVYNATDTKWILVAGNEEFVTGDTPLFFQASAPSGYTKQTTHNNKAIRVVSGTGATSGGTTAFTSVFTNRTIAQANLPSYTLPDTFALSGSQSGGLARSVSKTQNNLDANSGTAPCVGALTWADTTLSLTGSVTSGGSGTAMDFAVQYIDVIVCSKD